MGAVIEVSVMMCPRKKDVHRARTMGMRGAIGKGSISLVLTVPQKCVQGDRHLRTKIESVRFNVIGGG
jgi:hypothetical protein